MEWLAQNWLWLVLIIGVMMMLSRGRHGGAMAGCCGGHEMVHEGPADKGESLSAGVPHAPGREDKVAQTAESGPSSHKHGRGRCC